MLRQRIILLTQQKILLLGSIVSRISGNKMKPKDLWQIYCIIALGKKKGEKRKGKEKQRKVEKEKTSKEKTEKSEKEKTRKKE